MTAPQSSFLLLTSPQLHPDTGALVAVLVDSANAHYARQDCPATRQSLSLALPQARGNRRFPSPGQPISARTIRNCPIALRRAFSDSTDRNQESPPSAARSTYAQRSHCPQAPRRQQAPSRTLPGGRHYLWAADGPAFRRVKCLPFSGQMFPWLGRRRNHSSRLGTCPDFRSRPRCRPRHFTPFEDRMLRLGGLTDEAGRPAELSRSVNSEPRNYAIGQRGLPKICNRVGQGKRSLLRHRPRCMNRRINISPHLRRDIR
jgi:hypothetical protein